MLSITDVRKLYLGVQGENEEQTITIDVKPWLVAYPNAAISIWHKRNGDSVPQPVGSVYDAEAGTVSWTPTYTDTFVHGEGEAEIRLYDNGVIKKTRKVITGVSPSVTEAGGETLESGWQGYITYIESLKAGAISAKNDAEEAAEDAAEKADVAVHPPVIDEETGNWLVWDAEDEEYKDSGIRAIGKSFVITETYASVAAMLADFDNPDIAEGDYVIISSGSTDADNGKVYMKGDEAWEFVVQMAGQKGDTGETGTTFTPSVSAEGVISWTNDGGKENPTSRNIKGPKGDDGNDGAPGEGVPEGGTAGQFLKKKSGTDFDTEWDDVPDPTGKADKVSGATSGNFAALDANGNLTDSGHKHSDYLTAHQDITGKADKVSSATSGNFAALDANGNLTDSGHKHSDYLTEHQDISGKLDKPSTAGTNGQVLTSDGAGGQSWQTPSGGTVTDVQEDGVSILSSGVANILTMTGAGASAAGTKGLVPAPSAGDQEKLLSGGGTWVQKTGANTPMSGTDSTPVKEAIEAIANVVTEIPLTIAPSDWAASSPYSYTWTDSRVLADSSVEVEIQDSSVESGMLYLSYEKSSGGGGIVFTPSSIPTANVAVLIIITNAQAHSGSSIDADTVATDAVSGAANVEEALALHTDAITKIGNFGDWVAASLPFTPTADGFLYMWLNPSSTSGAYVRLTYTQNTRTIQLALNAKAGDGVSGIFPVKKNCQITQATLTNGTVGCSFMPLA